MPELVAVVKLVQDGNFVEPGEKFTVDDENAEKLLDEGSASKSSSRAKSSKE